MTELFEYRLVKDTYRAKLVYDDGPGSMRDVVHVKIGSAVISEWGYADEEFGERLLQLGDGGLRLEREPADGSYAFSYRLERRVSGDEWEYVGHLHADV